jgi:hypothetical protein
MRKPSIANAFLYVYNASRKEGHPMEPDLTTLVELEKERERLRQEISLLPDMRQGSLTAVYRRCGKPTCHCAQEEDPGHGPLFLLTRSVNKKTVARNIPSQEVETVRAQVAVFHHYQELSRELVNVSGQICDIKLRNPGLSDESVKKNTRKQPGS